jgi:RNA polymerase sigma-70 factor, ECF subfamily
VQLQLLLLRLLLLQLLLHTARRLQQLRAGPGTPRQLLLAMTQVHQATETEEIWRTLSDRLRRFILAHTGSATDAEDILQSTFLRIHENIRRLRHSDRLEPWVFQIARNAIADHFRKSRPDPLESEVESTPTADKRLLNLNCVVAGCLGTLIEQLPDYLQRAVKLYEQEGISQLEIAKRESISLSGAKSRVQRGRRRLRELLENCCQLQFDRRGNVLNWQRNAQTCDCNSCG